MSGPSADADEGLRESVRRSREAQGLPPVVEDVATLARVAALFQLLGPVGEEERRPGSDAA